MQHLDIFAIVVEQESLNKASHVLNLSQPALSRKIMALEEELGVKLFDRKGKRLELTRAGHLCYEYAVQARELEKRFLESLGPYAAYTGPKSITFGASLTTLQATLPELLALFTEEYPETDITAITGKTHEIVSLVKENKVDLGLVASGIDHPGLHCEALFNDHLVLVVPAAHPLAGKPEARISDLNELPMILFGKGTWYRILMDELFHRYAAFPVVKMEIDSFEAILRLVTTLRTATLLPQSYLTGSLRENRDWVMIELPELNQTIRTTSLIFTDEAAAMPVVQSLIAKAKRFFDKTGSAPVQKEAPLA